MRPPSFTLTVRALWTLPYRLCNPPPAAGNVRSCKVTPLIKITLDDVLNKRHLPPLTLKDFEEWLVFVEGRPQYLYFILWLKEYESRYAAWLSESGCASPSKSASTTTLASPDVPNFSALDLSYINLIPSSPPLALFFTRAKQTFLDPSSNSPYALGPDAVASLIAAHTPSTHSLTPSIPQFTIPDEKEEPGALPTALASQPHPHPKELAPLALYCRKILKDSVERFAATACHNVGTRRAWCGIAGGTFITLAFGIVPALAALFFAPTRWWRIVGWLGCWIGGTVVVSSFHGMCMMIYLFGDLRQLRSFELARPSISEPRAIARARPRLKSLFTRTEETGTSGTAPSSEHPASPNPTAPPSTPASNHNPAQSAPETKSRPRPYALTIPTQEKEKETKKERHPWSAASHTSTGTPIVHLGPDAFKFNVGLDTMESDVTTAEITVESAAQGDPQATEDDFGIEISPAYYYPEPKADTEAGEEAVQSRERGSVRSGASARMGMVMNWVMGKRASSVVGSGTGVVSEKAGEVHAPTQSHAGTFGIRSWRGGLGSLPEHSGAEVAGAAAEDLEKGGDGEKLPMDAAEENLLTAEFIPHEYPEPEPEGEKAPKEEVAAKEKTNLRVTIPPPVKFDFDKLPAARRTPTSPSFSDSQPAVSQHQQLPSPEQALYAHPGARLATSSPTQFLAPPPPSPGGTNPRISDPKERQWWDTCPRHPAVEATLAAQNPTSQLDTSRTSSPSSFDAHSRTRVHSPSPYAFPAAHPERRTPSQAKSPRVPPATQDGSWRARFRRVTAVPAFGPLTRVLSPVVSRGQWEIVVRSAVVAAFGAWVFIGCFVALPEIG